MELEAAAFKLFYSHPRLKVEAWERTCQRTNNTNARLFKKWEAEYSKWAESQPPDSEWPSPNEVN